MGRQARRLSSRPNGDKQATKQGLREFMRQTRQSMLAMLSEVIIVEKLPLLGSGKTDYVTLKSWQGGKAEQDD